MRAPAGAVDHAVDNIEIAPASLLVVRAAAHQAVARLPRSLLGEVVLQQLDHGRQSLTDLAVGEILRPRDQFTGEEIQLAGGYFHLGHIRYGAVTDPPHKARVS